MVPRRVGDGSGDHGVAISGDGTQIACERGGSGPTLLLVHGTGADHTYWERLAPELGRHFTTYAMDRRGRGQSGDAERYSIQEEFVDVATVIDSIPGPVNVLGHSYGALCSLEAAFLTAGIGRMVIYEPPVHTTVDVSYPAEVLERFYSYLESGEEERALLMLYRLRGMSDHELNALRSRPSWGARLHSARTIPREIFSVRDYVLDPSRFAGLRTPLLFLLGIDSLRFYGAATEALHASIPGNQITVLPGQGHEAAITAPELVLQEVLRVFKE